MKDNYNIKRYNIDIEKDKRDLPQLYNTKDECCGCAACKMICSVNAISMEYDQEGFLYPVVNSSICICCYRCMKVCPLK